MKKRYKMKSGKSRRMFSRTASHTHKLNMNGNPMRGGIRLT